MRSKLAMDIGSRLRTERKRLRLSQKDLGQMGGVTQSTQQQYEKGSFTPPATYLSLISSSGVDVCYVVLGGNTARLGLSENLLAIRSITEVIADWAETLSNPPPLEVRANYLADLFEEYLASGVLDTESYRRALQLIRADPDGEFPADVST